MSRRAWLEGAPRRADAAALTAVGLAARLGIVAWASSRFPPVEDGRFYHVLATRIAHGQGYSWLWPDGAVTSVAHYPVGYPAALGALYALFGATPTVAMIANALLGALSVWAVHRIAASAASRAGAALAGLAVALHPALVLYTPALMTEGVTAALIAVAGWFVVMARVAHGRRRWAPLVGLGLVIGIATLVRPQTLLFAPLFGWFAGSRSRFSSAALVCAIAFACVLPWTARNCAKMDRCVLVSANGGWNLLIGATPGATGTFVPIAGDSVPEPCRTVWGEAAKDRCFEQAAVGLIRRQPLRWLSLVPAKLAYTFEYCGAAGWYLHASNPAAFDDRAKVRLGAVETVWQRVLMVLALLALARAEGPRRRLRGIISLVSVVLMFLPLAWLGVVGLVAAGLLLGRRLEAHPPAALAVACLAATLATHAVFFGAGRYSLPCFTLLAALAGCFLTPPARAGDTSPDQEEPSPCP